jgi:hypothetical protein
VERELDCAASVCIGISKVTNEECFFGVNRVSDRKRTPRYAPEEDCKSRQSRFPLRPCE